MGVTSRYNRTGWAGRAPPPGCTGTGQVPCRPFLACNWVCLGIGRSSDVQEVPGREEWCLRVQLPPDLEGVWKSLQPGEFPQSSCRPGSLVKQIRGMWHPRGTHCSERCRNISSCDPHSKPATWVSLLLHTMDGREIERLSQGTQQGGSGAGTEGHGPALCS